jgi:hypothetical protein
VNGDVLAERCMLMVPGSHRGGLLDHHRDGAFVGAISPSQGAGVDAWPLLGVADLGAYNRQILRREATLVVRETPVSAGIPLPLPATAATIFEMQAGARKKVLDTGRGQSTQWPLPR